MEQLITSEFQEQVLQVYQKLNIDNTTICSIEELSKQYQEDIAWIERESTKLHSAFSRCVSCFQSLLFILDKNDSAPVTRCAVVLFSLMSIIQFVPDGAAEQLIQMLIELFDSCLLLFCEKVRIDLHRHTEDRVTGQPLHCLDVHIRVVQHGR